jgi:hypothetical protein
MMTHRGTMRNRQVGRWLRRFAGRSAPALAVLLACGLMVLKVHDWPVDRAMARFRAAPSAQHAARLTQLLAEGSVRRGQGERILRLLLQPKIVTRAAYAVGQPVGISVARPPPLRIAENRIQFRFREEEWAGARPMRRGEPSTGVAGDLSEIFLARGLPTEPRVYHGEICTTCKIINTAIRKPTLWDRFYVAMRKHLRRLPAPRRPVSVEPTYECRFAVPFDLNVVEGDRAEQVERIADPQADGTMRAVIATLTSEQRGIYETAAGRRGYHGRTYLTFKTLPLAVALELSLRLTDGRELPAGVNSQRQHLRVRAGTSGIFLVEVGSFGLTEPGEYRGTLVLRPDPDYAYEDPAIKSIWNGRLEFPVHFTVTSGPNTGK